jgi:putative ABC transport system ATP-binding protein
MVEIVRLQNVHKKYRIAGVDFTALEGVSLSIPKGGFTSIVGPTGSGRIVLLNIIACMCPPSSGRVTVCGMEVARASPESVERLRRTSIGYFSSAQTVISDLTVRENLDLSFHLLGRGTDVGRTVVEMLSETGLSGKEAQLSGGLSELDSRRLAVARSMIGDPPLLVCDDPNIGLPESQAETMIHLLQRFASSRNTTIVVGGSAPLPLEVNQSVINVSRGRVLAVSEEGA